MAMELIQVFSILVRKNDEDYPLKYILGIVLVLIAATVYFITRPDPEFVAGQRQNIPETPADNAQKDKEQIEYPGPASQIDARRNAMETEFEKLEVARRNLESRLNRLKAIMWGKEIEKEQQEAITREMKNGYMLLKDKKLMGAYSDVSEISSELSKIEFIDNYLLEIENQFRSERLK